MPRTVRTAKGELVDFDAIVIKQQIAEAPMNIEVARRKNFIDAKEGKGRGQRKVVPPAPVQQSIIAPVSAPSTPADFEIPEAPFMKSKTPLEEPVPNLPDRKK